MFHWSQVLTLSSVLVHTIILSMAYRTAAWMHSTFKALVGGLVLITVLHLLAQPLQWVPGMPSRGEVSSMLLT